MNDFFPYLYALYLFRMWPVMDVHNFCCSQQYFLLYNSTFSLWGSLTYPFAKTLFLLLACAKFCKSFFLLRCRQNYLSLFLMNSFFVIPILIRTSSFVTCFVHSILRIHWRNHIFLFSFVVKWANH